MRAHAPMKHAGSRITKRGEVKRRSVTLHLLPSDPSIDDIARLFEALTGKKAPEAEIESLQQGMKDEATQGSYEKNAAKKRQLGRRRRGAGP